MNLPKPIQHFTCRTCANWRASRDISLDRKNLICDDQGTCFYFPSRKVEDSFKCKSWKLWPELIKLTPVHTAKK